MDRPTHQGVFHSPYTYVSDSFNTYHLKSPPPDHPNAITCPQCDGLTWLMTDCCIHCGINITAHYQEQVRLELLEELQIKYRQQKKEILLVLGLIFICVMALILCSIIEPTNPYIYWIPIGVIVGLTVFFKPIDEEMKELSEQIRNLSNPY